MKRPRRCHTNAWSAVGGGGDSLVNLAPRVPSPACSRAVRMRSALLLHHAPLHRPCARAAWRGRCCAAASLPTMDMQVGKLQPSHVPAAVEVISAAFSYDDPRSLSAALGMPRNGFRNWMKHSYLPACAARGPGSLVALDASRALAGVWPGAYRGRRSHSSRSAPRRVAPRRYTRRRRRRRPAYGGGPVRRCRGGGGGGRRRRPRRAAAARRRRRRSRGGQPYGATARRARLPG